MRRLIRSAGPILVLAAALLAPAPGARCRRVPRPRASAVHGRLRPRDRLPDPDAARRVLDLPPHRPRRADGHRHDRRQLRDRLRRQPSVPDQLGRDGGSRHGHRRLSSRLSHSCAIHIPSDRSSSDYAAIYVSLNNAQGTGYSSDYLAIAGKDTVIVNGTGERPGVRGTASPESRCGPSAAAVDPTTTDSAGKYSLAVKKGACTFSVEAPKGESATPAEIHLNLSHDVDNVDFSDRYRKSADPTLAGAARAATGQASSRARSPIWTPRDRRSPGGRSRSARH